MKQLLKSILCLTLLASNATVSTKDCNDCSISCESSCNDSCSTSCSTSCNDSCNDSCDKSCSSSRDIGCCSGAPKTSIHWRSQGANTARELVGWQWEINRPDMCENYGAMYLAYEYQATSKSKKIAESLFGTSTLSFSGSQVADRQAGELLADNFGLSQCFRGAARVCPKIENHIVDFGFYYGLDCFWQGSYFRLHAPIAYTKWDLHLKQVSGEDVPAANASDNSCYYDAFDTCYVNSNQDSERNVNPTDSIVEALSGKFLFGDMQTPWSAGRFAKCDRTKVGLADIDLILGYNWLNEDCYHFGAYIQAVLPTGGKARNTYVFNPVVGNGGHFELGAGISAHAVLWSGEDSNLALFLEGNVTHMFRSKQCRLASFCQNGAYSQYSLLKEFKTTSTPNYEYNGNLINAASFNNRVVDVRLDVKGDASLKLAYRFCGWGLDLGYNIYGHSREKIDFDCKNSGCSDNGQFQIKGNTSVCDIIAGTPQTIPNDEVQPSATAFAAGENVDINNAVFLSTSNLDFSSAEAAAVLTHKVFVFGNYTWMDECGWNPNIGIGGEFEFSGNNNNAVCNRANINQWGVLVKGGISF